MENYESILLVKPEVFVYKIPPRASNRGFRAADWNLTVPDWTGRLRLVSKSKDCVLKLEDKNTGELFAKCPIDKYPGIALEAVADSSRYFVLRIQDDNGRSAFIGIGFADRGDSFDLNVALQDHFKWLEKTEEIEQEEKDGAVAGKPQLDLSFKEGQTITINIGQKKMGTSRPKSKGTGSGLLPPPPSGAKIALPALATPSSVLSTSQTNKAVSISNGTSAESNLDLLLDLGGGVGSSEGVVVVNSNLSTLPVQLPSQTNVDFWGEFENA